MEEVNETPFARMDGRPTLPFYTGWRNFYQSFDGSIGIFNPLNLCYRNVILQLLLHTPLLLNFLELNCVPGHACVEPAALCTFCVLKAFVDAYWTGSRNEQDFTRALEALWEKLLVSFWAGAVEDLDEQQDAREFLERTLAQFHFEATLVDPSASFQVVTHKQFECSACHAVHKADNLDQQYFLVADFPADGGRCTVDEAIVPGMHNALVRRCADCRADTEHAMVDKIVQLPEVLLVQVNRFAAQQDDHTKVQRRIHIDEDLTISDSIRDTAAPDRHDGRYELYAVVFHRGLRVTKGHYTVAVKRPDGRWALLDDDADVVVRDSLDDLKQFKRTFERQAYILAYRQLPLTAEPENQNPSRRPYATKSVAHLPPPGPADSCSSTDSDGDTIIVDYDAPLPIAGGVSMVETIAFDGRDVDWIVKQQLLLPPEAGPLINLPPRAKVQRAKVKITMTSCENGEILEGEATISLRPQRREDFVADGSVEITKRTPLIKRLRPRGKPVKPAKTMNTKPAKTKTNAKTTKPRGESPAKPRGVAKNKASKASKASIKGRSTKPAAKAQTQAHTNAAPSPASSTPSQSPDPEGWVRRSKRWHNHHPTYAESNSS